MIAINELMKSVKTPNYKCNSSGKLIVAIVMITVFLKISTGVLSDVTNSVH